MTKKEIQQIKNILQTEAGKVLIKFIQEHINKLRDIDSIDESEDIALEVKARRRAKAILDIIFSELSILQQKEKTQEQKNPYL